MQTAAADSASSAPRSCRKLVRVPSSEVWAHKTALGRSSSNPQVPLMKKCGELWSCSRLALAARGAAVESKCEIG